jgi:hypothetical protein
MKLAPNPITVADSGAGRLLIRTGYAVVLVGVAAAIVVSVRAWGESSSVSLLGCVAVMWAGSGAIAYGRKLSGELPAGSFSLRKALLSLPLGLVLAYYGLAIEHFGIWWALLLPHLTYSFLAAMALPHWPALGLTILGAPVEMIITASISQMLVVSPLSAVLGRGHPIVEGVRDLVGGVEVSDGEPVPVTGRQESTAWAGESMLP